jgi:chromosome partitioning protein
MGLIISVIGQKGGPGKSTVSRAVATCYAAADWDVKIADLDINQSTSFSWLQRRLRSGIEPVLSIETFGTADHALKQADNYDLLIIDGAPTASRATQTVSEAADLIVITTQLGLDDLEPAVKIANNLTKSGIDANKICFVLNHASGSDIEYNEVREYLSATPYFVIDGRIEHKPCYRQAMNEGLSIIETKFKQPREKAAQVIQNIIDRLEYLTK